MAVNLTKRKAVHRAKRSDQRFAEMTNVQKEHKLK